MHILVMVFVYLWEIPTGWGPVGRGYMHLPPGSCWLIVLQNVLLICCSSHSDENICLSTPLPIVQISIFNFIDLMGENEIVSMCIFLIIYDVVCLLWIACYVLHLFILYQLYIVKSHILYSSQLFFFLSIEVLSVCLLTFVSVSFSYRH